MTKTKNILVLTYWSYKEGLIQTYTLPYVRIIRKNIPAHRKVYLFTLEKENLALTREEKTKVKKELKSEGIIWMPRKYFPFGGTAMFKWVLLLPQLWFKIMFSGISHLHCWCTPPGMIGYLLSKSTGKKLVLDSYEPHAEAMVENGDWEKSGRAFKLLFKYEKKQSHRATHIISATAGMRKYAKEKYNLSPKSFFVKPACVDLDLFDKSKVKDPELIEKLNLSGKIICVYAGKLGGIYYDVEVFKFIKQASIHWGERFCFLFLTNHSRTEINDLCDEVGLDKSVVISQFVMHQDIPKYIGLGDFGLTPVKQIKTKRYCTPIKDGEYWALGLPVVISPNISDDSSIISQKEIGVICNFEQSSTFSSTIEQLDELLKESSPEDRYTKIRYIANEYRNFSVAEQIYKKIYFNG